MRIPRWSLCGALLAALPLAACADGEPPPEADGAAPAALLSAEAQAAAALLSDSIPHDVTITSPEVNLAAFQHDFDEYSWQTFVALNWPALPNGDPDPRRVIGQGGDAPAVWESYKETFEIFLADGSRPAPWGAPRQLPAACQGVAPAGTPVLNMIQKAPQVVLDAMGQPFRTGPLVDQDSNYVRFAISLNRPAFEFIVNNRLYNKQGQAAFTQPVVFPVGSNSDADSLGAIIIKSAWKIITPDDIAGRYHTRQVLVYTPPSAEPPVQESCALQTVGLVGWHAAHKTADAPQWIWTTFEHVDNLSVPPNSGLRPSFHNPDCKDCAVNTPPTPPWDPNVKTAPTQVVRDIPIDEATQALNAEWQGRLRTVDPRSPWQYYELISTQWPTNPGAPGTGNPAPQFLANTTLETYVQGRVPNVSSSCIMCHNNATTTASRPSDLSYTLQLANDSVAAAGGRP